MADAKSSSIAPKRRYFPMMSESAENSVMLFMIGGAAGVVSRTAVSPLERLKIIFQTQTPGNKYGSISGSLIDMYKQEGFRGYFKGNGINCIRMFPTNALQFYFYDFYKSLIPLKEGKKELTPVQRVYAGAACGITALVATYPLDFLRAYLTVQKENLTIMQVSRLVYQKKGPIGFFKGLWPSILGVVPYTGVDFAMYDLMKQIVPHREDGTISPFWTVVNGGCAGAVAQTVSYPLDVVRRRMQVQVFAEDEALVYKGTWDAFKKIYEQEGMIGYFRGWVPNFYKVVPALAISFLTYETLKDAMGIQVSKK